MNEDEFARALLAHERREWQNPERILAEIGVKPGITVADLACGPGFFTVPMARIVGRVYAVDSSKTMLEYLRSNLKRSGIDQTVVEIIESDVTNSNIPSQSSEIVLFANIFHALRNQKKFLKEVKRISKNPGFAIDIDWKKAEDDLGPPLEIRLSEDRVREILADNGFDVVRTIDVGPYHYGIICNSR